MTISEKKFVTVSYELYVGEKDEKPELMEKTSKENPLKFIFGTGMMLEKFEENLKGLKAGDKFDFEIKPEEAYGEYEDENIIKLDKSIFEVDGELDSEVLFEGNVVPMMDNAGNRLSGTVVSITDNQVEMDFNHPLAGETLHFTGEVLEVRDATEEEIAAFTQPGCGGGCSQDDCGECSCGCN
ncbi:MAG: peptidylprolyl isomerase [Prevotellaceae bacterium]|jgi:FKBP-type peptidyl-prolyl cis-trans isomerase SlyD|nr:peptidylprolyl isomerase [Prevotellaceae bacterium]